MPRARFNDSVLWLISRVICTTPGEAAREAGAKTHTMQITLERFASAGMLKKYLVMNRIAVYCAHNAAYGDVVRALLRAYSINERLLVKKLRELVYGARGGRICISKPSVYPINTPLINTAVITYVLSLLGGVIRRGRFGRVYVCADTQEARRRLEGGVLYPPDGLIREAAPYYTHAPRIDRYTVTISFHLPPGWVEAMDRLVRDGKYASRAEIVRTAIRQLLERLRP